MGIKSWFSRSKKKSFKDEMGEPPAPPIGKEFPSLPADLPDFPSFDDSSLPELKPVKKPLFKKTDDSNFNLDNMPAFGEKIPDFKGVKKMPEFKILQNMPDFKGKEEVTPLETVTFPKIPKKSKISLKVDPIYVEGRVFRQMLDDINHISRSMSDASSSIHGWMGKEEHADRLLDEFRKAISGSERKLSQADKLVFN